MVDQRIKYAAGAVAVVAVLLVARRARAAEKFVPDDSAGRVGRWRPLAEKYGNAAGVPVDWILATIAQESGGDPQAGNFTGGDAARGGARGLMQMTLRTARGLGFEGDPDELFDPETNIRLGVMLLKDGLRRHGAMADSSCAYNSGKPCARAPEFTTTHYLPGVQAKRANFAGVGFAAVGRLQMSSRRHIA